MKYRFLIALILIVLILSSQNYAQNMCPITTLKVGRIRGKLVTNDPQQDPVKQTKVELFSLGETDSLVASTLTDDLGYFEIGNVKKGRYAVEATVLHLDTYRFALKVRKSNDSKSNSLILVKLGVDCFNSEVSIDKR